MVIPVSFLKRRDRSSSFPFFCQIIGYFIFDLGMTGTGAYGLLPLSITNNYDERNFIISWLGLGQGFGALRSFSWERFLWPAV